MEKHKRTAIITVLSFIILQIIITVMLILNNRYDVVLGNTFITIVFTVYTYIEFRLNIHMENYIRILLAVVIINHTLVGELFKLYVTSTVFDKVLHLVGTYGFSLFTYTLINQLIFKPSSSKKKEFIIIAALGISLGTCFETIEFVLDLIMDPVIAYQTDLTDTNFDIIFNTIGAVTAAFHMTVFKKSKN